MPQPREQPSQKAEPQRRVPAAGDAAARETAGSFEIQIDTGSPSHFARRRRRSSPIGLVLLIVATVGVVGVVGWLSLAKPAATTGTVDASLVIAEIPPQTIDEGTLWSLEIPLKMAGIDTSSLRCSLVEAPQGMLVDERRRVLVWQPDEAAGPGEYTARLRVESGNLVAEQAVTLEVQEVDAPPRVRVTQKRAASLGETVSLAIRAVDADVPAQQLVYELVGDAHGATIDAATGQFTWDTAQGEAGYDYTFAVRVSTASGTAATTESFRIEVQAATRATTVAASPSPAATADKLPSESDVDATEDRPPIESADAPSAPPDVEAIAALYDAHRLFTRKPRDYVALRAAIVDRFQREQQAAIRQAFGEDYDALSEWLDERSELKQELYVAIRPEWDDVAAALALFRELWSEFPDSIERYGQLAIATAVVWDRDNRGIANLQNHVRAAKAVMPEGRLGAIENFRYLVEAVGVMQGRIEYVPWEFLVHVVNHKSPLEDRQWALANYLDERVGIGTCYHDCPYDTMQLDSNFAEAKMNGQLYTLANLRQLGGVCMFQADYAARIAKSLGVPASYVSGTGRFGGSHAWVMWVELLQATPSSVTFELKSHGRYRGDHYYTGNLRDARTGQPITDRDLEMRLHSAGVDVVAKRHAELLMRVYPELRDREPAMEPVEQLEYLRNVIDISPYDEAAWIDAAQLVKSLRGDRQFNKAMRNVLNALFTTFAPFPDFTWKVFHDLVDYHEDPATRIELYDRLVSMYRDAGRPDLSSEAILRLADELLAADRTDDALSALALTALRFPDEGRFVPKVVDRLEAICAEQPGSELQLVQFYTEILPQIPQKRGSRPSEYCISMYERAIECFARAGQNNLAATASAELQRIKSG